MKLIDLTGARFGRLNVGRLAGRDPSGKTTWECLCDCGVVTVTTGLNLKTGNTTSCGCAKNKQRPDLAAPGDVHGQLTVLRRVGSRVGRALYECRCSCGVLATVAYTNLKRGVTKSCGCMKLGNGAKRWEGERTTTKAAWAKRVTNGQCCAKCGAMDGLHAHHILPASAYPDLRADGSNGIPLCAGCHREYHSRFHLSAASARQLCIWLGMDDLLVEFFDCFVGYRHKGGIQDLEKAKHVIDMLIEFEREKLVKEPEGFDGCGNVGMEASE